MRAIAILCALSGAAYGADAWDSTDKALLVTMTAFQAADLMQTTHIARHPESHHEMNPLLEEHPTVGQTRAAFAIGYAVRVGVAVLLPSRYRKWWLGGLTVASGVTVAYNIRNGIGLSW